NLQNVPGDWHVVTRHGRKFNCYELKEGESIEVCVNRPYSVRGVLAAFGPGSGTISVYSHVTGISVEAALFDQYSYYERIAEVGLPAGIYGALTITLLPSAPVIKLLKGAFSSGPRVARISHLLLGKDK